MESVAWSVLLFVEEVCIEKQGATTQACTQEETLEGAFKEAAAAAMRLLAGVSMHGSELCVLISVPESSVENAMVEIIPEDQPYTWPSGRWRISGR